MNQHLSVYEMAIAHRKEREESLSVYSWLKEKMSDTIFDGCGIIIEGIMFLIGQRNTYRISYESL